MTRRAPIFWRNREVGTIPLIEHLRPPIEQVELDAWPAPLFIQSRSWLFQVRPGDVRLELRGRGADEVVVAVASNRLGPGDIGCIVGFEPAAGYEDMVDERILAIADDVLAKHRRG